MDIFFGLLSYYLSLKLKDFISNEQVTGTLTGRLLCQGFVPPKTKGEILRIALVLGGYNPDCLSAVLI